MRQKRDEPENFIDSTAVYTFEEIDDLRKFYFREYIKDKKLFRRNLQAYQEANGLTKLSEDDDNRFRVEFGSLREKVLTSFLLMNNQGDDMAKRALEESFLESLQNGLDKLKRKEKHLPIKSKANKMRYYSLQKDYYGMLIEEAKEQLEKYDADFEISLRNCRHLIGNLRKYKEHEKLKKITREKSSRYVKKAKRYEKKYDAEFSNETRRLGLGQVKHDKATKKLLV